MSRIFEAMQRAAAKQGPTAPPAPGEAVKGDKPNVYDALKRIVEKNSANSPLHNIAAIGGPLYLLLFNGSLSRLTEWN